MSMRGRGKYAFQLNESEKLFDNAQNFALTQRMFLDWNLIQGQGGPGTLRDGKGSWHVLCHLAGAAGLFRTRDGEGVWAGIMYDPGSKRYMASISFLEAGRPRMVFLNRKEGWAILVRCEFCGFVEGASQGHILDRNANDPGDPEKDDRRQDYDQDVNSKKDGGPVWEHWTTSRDIVSKGALGNGLLRAYVTLTSMLGGSFPATVARGRFEPEYAHTIQLCAMIEAGFISVQDALRNIKPTAIPKGTSQLLLEATPKAFAEAASQLVAVTQHKEHYFMYERKILSFLPAEVIVALSRTFARRGQK